jgi:hypothetical protein
MLWKKEQTPVVDTQNVPILNEDLMATMIPKEGEQAPLDVLIVLGRGIDEHGNLSETGRQRADYAARLVELGIVKTVIFSGGHSWQQEEQAKETGTVFASEGSGMMHRAQAYLEERNVSRIGTRFIAEKKSTTTAENFANTKGILDWLGYDKKSVIGIMSDDLHFSAGRIQLLGSVALPGNHKTIVRIENATVPTPEQIQEEKLITLATRLFMVGVRKGNVAGMMRRHDALAKVNRWRQKFNGSKQTNIDFTINS